MQRGNERNAAAHRRLVEIIHAVLPRRLGQLAAVFLHDGLVAGHHAPARLQRRLGKLVRRMQAAHRLHNHADIGVAEDAGEVVRHHAAQRVRVKGAQVQHALDAERFAAEAARDVRAVARDDLVHAVADGAETEYSNINHRFFSYLSQNRRRCRTAMRTGPCSRFCFERAARAARPYMSLYLRLLERLKSKESRTASARHPFPPPEKQRAASPPENARHRHTARRP